MQLNQSTKRDLGHVIDGINELRRDLKSPLFWISLAIFVFFLVAPWVMD